MGTFTYPGVYIEELPSGVHTISGVATSIAAFVGWAPQGPTNRAVLVQSFMDYQRQFGGLDARSLLGYAVSQFFNNGGQQAYVVRLTQSAITSGTGTAPTAGSATVAVAGGDVVFTAKNPGIWSGSYGALVSASSGETFTLSTVYAPQGSALVTLETLTGVSVASLGSSTSKVLALTETGSPTAAPANGLYMLTGGIDANGVNVPGAGQASATIFCPGSTTAGFTFTAQSPGAWGNLIAVGATPQPGDSTGLRFSLNVVSLGASGTLSVVENFNNLSVSPTDPTYVVTVLNNDSNYVTVAAVGSPAKALNSPFPPASSSSAPYATPPFLTGGFDGVVLDPTADSSSGGLFMTALNAGGTGTGGVHLLDNVGIFNLLCVPGESEASTISLLQQYCHQQRAFYIVDSPQTATIAGLQTSGPAGVDTGSLTGQYSINSAYYFPWVQAPDPLIGGRQRMFPPSGFVAGIYASTDATRGVWKAPAGIDASLTGNSGLQFVLTDLQNGSLNTQAVNCLRQFNVYGDVVWGARTLQGNDQAGSQWKYVPIRRLALYIESSLYDGTQWVVFEPNDQTLWGQIRLNVGTFMQGLFLQGAFAGTTPAQAYFVKCDADNNPPSSVALGIVNILVGFAPLYPAEFVVIQIQQMAGQTQA
jgi:phage tail sheath protein FI